MSPSYLAKTDQQFIKHYCINFENNGFPLFMLYSNNFPSYFAELNRRKNELDLEKLTGDINLTGEKSTNRNIQSNLILQFRRLDQQATHIFYAFLKVQTNVGH